LPSKKRVVLLFLLVFLMGITSQSVMILQNSQPTMANQPHYPHHLNTNELQTVRVEYELTRVTHPSWFVEPPTWGTSSGSWSSGYENVTTTAISYDDNVKMLQYYYLSFSGGSAFDYYINSTWYIHYPADTFRYYLQVELETDYVSSLPISSGSSTYSYGFSRDFVASEVVLSLENYFRIWSSDGSYADINHTVAIYALNQTSGADVLVWKLVYTQTNVLISSSNIINATMTVDYILLHFSNVGAEIVTEDSLKDGYVLHVAEVEVPSQCINLYVKYPEDWSMYAISPDSSYTTMNSTTIRIPYPLDVTYKLYFISYDTWEYPEYENSRVAYLNSKGEYLDFDQFHTYIAESPSRLIRYAPDVNDPDLVAWFRFNEGTGTKTYDWKQGLEGTLYGSPSWATGYIGDAIEFDGTDDYVSVSGISVSVPFSIEFWLYRESDSGTIERLIQLEGNPYGIYVQIDTLQRIQAGFKATTGSFVNIYSYTKILLNQWYHVIFIYDGSMLYLYINGRLDNTYATTAQVESLDGIINIGRLKDTTTYYYNFHGIIDEPRIWQKRLTSEEAWWHYALALYYDGQKDMLGRTALVQSGTITRGIFGSAFEMNPEYLSNPNASSSSYKDAGIKYSKDYALQLHNSFSLIIFMKPYWSSITGTSEHWWTFISKDHYSNDYWITYNPNYKYFDLRQNKQAQRYTWSVDLTSLNQQYILFVLTYSLENKTVYLYSIDGSYQEHELSRISGDRDDIITTDVSGNVWIGSDLGTTYHFKGILDEVILLNQPISPQMIENLWKIAKPYIGGYYTDTEFGATWNIEQDSPEDGNGYAEDFSDISEWTNIFSYQSFTTDGDVANYTIDGSQTSIVWGHVEVKLTANISTSEYPFLEVRYNYYEVDPPDEYFYIYLMSGSSEVGQAYYDGGDNNGEWVIGRINLLEKLGNVQFDEIRIQIRAGAGDFAYVLLDWLRVYGFQGASGIAYTTDIDSDDWITSIGGVLEIHSNFETTNDEFLGVKYDVPNFDGSDKVCEIRFKGYIWLLFVMTTSVYEYIFNANDWVVLQIDLSDGSRTVLSGTVTTVYAYTGGSGSITEIRIGQNDISGYDAGEYYGYVDYLRIGYSDNEKLQDTSWESLLYPIYEHPKSGYVWFNTTDIFGNVLVYEPRSYSVYQDFVLPLYSWKFKNNKDNTFIHINISRNGFHWSEWLAPKEVARYDLYSGNYTLRITYPDNSYFETTISVTQDYYWMLSGNTLGDVLTGIDNLYYNITNVNQTLYNQIINVNISLTNWNSQINNTVVNVYLNLTNVNSSLGDLILNNYELIKNLNTNMTNQFLNLDVNIYNNFTTISGQILSVNNTVLNVNATIDYQHNQISTQITNLQTNMTYQINWVLNNITNVNSTIHAQLIDLSTQITNLQDNITIQINDVSTQIDNVNTSLSQQINDISVQITNLQSHIDGQFSNIEVWLYNNFSQINAQVISVNNTILNVNSTIDYQHNQITTLIYNVQDNVTTQINDVKVLINNLQSSMDAQFTNVEVWIYNNFTHIEAQILSVNNTIININSTISQQISQVSLQITNLQTNVTTQFNYVFENITNVNATIHTQLIFLSTEINNFWTNMNYTLLNMDVNMNNNFTNIQTQIVTVNNTVLNVNSTLISANHTIINQITNLNNSMTYQFTHVITNITNVNNTLYQQTQTIKEDIVDLAHTEYRNPPPEPTKVPVVGDLVTSEAGQVIAGFGIILAIIFAFMYIVERGRRISIEEERSAKRMLNALKK